MSGYTTTEPALRPQVRYELPRVDLQSGGQAHDVDEARVPSPPLNVEMEERKLKAEGYIPVEGFSHVCLEKRQPAFALVRSWAGHENEVKALRQQIERMVGICGMAASALEAAGQVQEARRIRRAIKGW